MLAYLVIFVSSWAELPQPGMHPLPSGVLSTLYSSPTQTGRGALSISIRQVVGYENLLFVALADSEGHEIIDVWNTRNVSKPVLVQSLDFGRMATNGVMFTPLAMVPFRDGLFLQTRTGLSLYRTQADGQLTFDSTLPRLINTLGLDLTQIHVAGQYGSLLQQVIPNREITADNLDQIHKQVLVDFSNPARPLLLWAGYDGPSLMTDEPINATYLGNPASLSINAASNTARMVLFEPTLKAQSNTYWTPKIQKVFSQDALALSIKELLRQTLSHADLPSLQTKGMRVYANACGPETTLLADRILEHHQSDHPLKDVLAQYQIAMDDPLELALAKVIGGHLDANLEAKLGSEWHAIPLQQWLRVIMSPGLDLASASRTKEGIIAAFNQEIDEATAARYLTLHVVGPLLGNPAFLETTLDELIGQLTESSAGQAIDILLKTAGGFGTLNGVLDGIRSALDSLPGVDIPRLPSSAQFPDSTEKLINMALFSWNDSSRGISLNREGLAWFELLKFYQYLNGNTEFIEYTATINRRLRQMQETLGTNLAGRLSEAFIIPEESDDLLARQGAVTAQLPTRLLIGRLIALAVIDSLPTNANLSATLPVGTALANWGLHVRQTGYSESTVSNLLVALKAHGTEQLTLGNIYDKAASEHHALFASHVEQVLRNHIQKSFGASDLNLSLLDVIQPCLQHGIGVPEVMGDCLDDLLSGFLRKGPGMSSLLLEYRHAFENHDSIAQWLVALDAIAAATSFTGGDMAAHALEYALNEGYRTGVGCVVNTMFGQLIREIMGEAAGNHSQWIALKMKSRIFEWNVAASTPEAVTTTLAGFTWQQKSGFIVQKRLESDWFGPRRLELVVCQPDNPEPTRKAYDLGRWQTVNYAHHVQGALYIAGSFFTDGDSGFPSGKAMVVDLESAEPRIQILKGNSYAALASAPMITSANHNACLAVAGLDRVLLIPNPAGYMPAQDEAGQPPQILQSLAAATVAFGSSHDFVVKVAGTPPFNFEWRKDGQTISSGQEPDLHLNLLTPHDSGQYSIIVSNAHGQITSEALLSVLPAEAFRIVEEPSDTTQLQGHPASMAVKVESQQPVSYAWFHQGRCITATNGPTLSFPQLGTNDAGEYHVEMRTPTALVRSRTAHVRVIPINPPQLLSAPAHQEALILGSPTTLTCTPVGWGGLTCRWYRNDQLIPGAQDPHLDLEKVTPHDGGKYRLEVIDASGTMATHTFTVVVVASARMTSQMTGEGHFEVSIQNGAPNQIYTLERSSDLQKWTQVKTGVFPQSGTVLYEDALPVQSFSGAYFRLRVEP